jgi:hypothetical protein
MLHGRVQSIVFLTRGDLVVFYVWDPRISPLVVIAVPTVVYIVGFRFPEMTAGKGHKFVYQWRIVGAAIPVYRSSAKLGLLQLAPFIIKCNTNP